MGTRLFFGNINDRISERDVEKFFKGYGSVREVTLKQGYGFVELSDDRDAADAVRDLDGKDLMGCRVSVEHARSSRGGGFRGRDNFSGGYSGYRGAFSGPRPYRGSFTGDFRNGGRSSRGGGGRFGGGGAPVRSDYRIVVTNLSSRVSWQDLKDIMRKAGEVTFADAHKKRPNEGIVEFANRSDMEYALDKFDDFEVGGRKIRVYKDGASFNRRSRSRSGRRGRSDSRSRSRDRKPRRKSRSRSHKRRNSSESRSRSGRKSYSSASRSRSASRGRKRQYSDESDDSRRSRDRHNGTKKNKRGNRRSSSRRSSSRKDNSDDGHRDGSRDYKNSGVKNNDKRSRSESN